jgi:hypothetical protein
MKISAQDFNCSGNTRAASRAESVGVRASDDHRSGPQAEHFNNIAATRSRSVRRLNHAANNGVAIFATV